MAFDPANDSYDSAGMELGETRFPEQAWGYEGWRRVLSEVEGWDRTPKPVQEPGNPIPLVDRPRVFVSHQQRDADPAKRIAWLSTSCGFSFWLDILDPDLEIMHGKNVAPEKRPLLLAQIVETALLNCTHVVALLTNNATESRWVPYEYGRVKERSLSTRLAMSWIAPDYQGYMPEYLVLGEESRDEAGLLAWFQGQRDWFLDRRKLKGLPPLKTPAWKGPPPDPLPT